ncbi:hypothetical protein [Kineococcus aurantiacus]|uniref:Uncharacterized protein n=1 Tax=Kineococcus aurantiacus TaxID=37633 RepID=A0A7Y9DMG6_9ACTN|nr:hypothetical protein [Kineococcus aurantiacus]NYD23327.1 hypothetical protein [Kineococcus aurantiacus]
MVPPADDVTGPGTGTRWSWVFWCALVAAALPALVSAALAVTTYQDDDLVRSWSSAASDPLEPGDRWAAVLRLDEPGWTSTVTALATLALAVAVAGGVPRWVRVPAARGAVFALGAGGLAWALVSAAATCAYLLSDLTAAEETARRAWGGQRLTFTEWGPTAGQLLLAAAVSGVAAWWSGYRWPGRSDEGVGQDALQRPATQ